MMMVASTHDTILLFSNKGKVFGLKTHEIPVASKASRGKSLKGIINLASGELISAMCSIPDFEKELSMCMATKLGILKKIEAKDFENAKKNGIIAINLKKADELVDVKLVQPNDDVVIASKKGNLLRTNLAKMRPMGRGAAGIIGMRLESDDEIIGTDVVIKGSDLFVVTENGYGKKMLFKNFATKGRGGKGMAYLKITDKNGHAIGIKSVMPKDEIIIASKSGMTIRLLAEDVSEQGRSTVGVRLLDTADNDSVSDFAILAADED
jgi:DNA gyrase subunit A